MRLLFFLTLFLLSAFGFAQSNNSDLNMHTQDTIRLFDEKGNEFSYPRKEYGEKILPGQIQKVWDSPDNLYGLIVASLQDGFNKELIDAGQRLVSIDYDTSRAYTSLGVIYLKSNLLEKSEQTLLEGIKICRNKSYLKTNLAKVYQAKGLSDKSYSTLWESIELDPNNDNAVIWLGAIHNERGGKEEYLKIMRKIAELPSSWRAQLWIARDYLENNDYESAIKIYKDILPKVTTEPDAMMMISGDLGKHGRSDQVMSMIYPLYDLNKQDYRTGINIISSCIETNNKTIGFKILNDIKKLDRHDLTNYLDRLETRLNQIEK
jgi:tetratricopeptide (TPR) repeat protein